MFITTSKKYFYINRGIGGSKVFSTVVKSEKIVKIASKKMVYGKSNEVNQRFHSTNPHLSKGPNHPGVLLNNNNDKTLFCPVTHSTQISVCGEKTETEFLGTRDFNGEKKEQYINTSKPIEVSKEAIDSQEVMFTDMPNPSNLSQKLLYEGALASVAQMLENNKFTAYLLDSTGKIMEKRDKDIEKDVKVIVLSDREKEQVANKKFFQNSIEEKE